MIQLFTNRAFLTLKCNLFFFLSFLISGEVLCQKIGIVDMGVVIEKMPEYAGINLQIDNYTKMWEEEIFNGEQKLKKLKEDFAKEEFFYTPSIKEKKTEDIKKLEQNVYNLSKKYFGYEGELFKKRQELVKPLQDKIYSVIQRIAREKMLDLILDKSAGSFVLYLDPKLDITFRVLQLLGF